MSIADGPAIAIADKPTTNNPDDDHIIGVRLFPHHVRELRASGLSDDTIRNARIHSEDDRVKLARYRNLKSYSAKLGPALVFPFIETDGNVEMRRLKPDRPQKNNKGKVAKYLQPSGVHTRPYFPPGVRDAAVEPKRELFITEGEKKALKGTQEGFPTIGLTGVDCWRHKQSTSLHRDLEEIKWHNRPTFVVFDSDAVDNDNVRDNECLLAAALKERGAIVKVVRLPFGPNGEKVGLDDYLVGPDRDGFRKLLDAAEEPEPPDPGTLKAPAKDIVFEDEAAAMIARETKDKSQRLWCWNGGFWKWHKSYYREVPDSEIRAMIAIYLNCSFFKVGQAPVGNVLEQLRAQAFLSGRKKPPTWLGKVGNDLHKKWAAKDLLVAKNAIIHLPTMLDGGTYRIDPTPALFNTNALDFDFVEEADCPKPKRWETFLAELWPDDSEAIEALQMWFGYCLVHDTSQHKILTLIGPKRSGKGTIARVLQSLIGRENVASPTLSSLSGNFGLWPLIGKSLAVIADARLSGRTDTAAVVERILSISGEDAQTIDRKCMVPVTMTLPTRIMLISNELPKLADASGALTGRMILLQLRESWFGREDHGLTDTLLTELPGILWWAIRGWARLKGCGRLLQPTSGQEALGDMEDLASPVGAFLREECLIGPEYDVPRSTLHHAYCEWADSKGRIHKPDESGFGRDLRAALSTLRTESHRFAGKRVRHYVGVALKAEGFDDE